MLITEGANAEIMNCIQWFQCTTDKKTHRHAHPNRHTYTCKDNHFKICPTPHCLRANQRVLLHTAYRNRKRRTVGETFSPVITCFCEELIVQRLSTKPTSATRLSQLLPYYHVTQKNCNGNVRWSS